MRQISVRFGIRNEKSQRAATWKLWTDIASSRSDVYLSCREIGGFLKTSFHESGRWHVAHSPMAYSEYVKNSKGDKGERFLEKWTQPPEIWPGTTLAYRIVTPHTAPSIDISERDEARVIWIENAPDEKATEVAILITTRNYSPNEWPGKNSMGTKLIGTFQIASGAAVWAVHSQIEMPQFEKQSAPGWFYNGKSRTDLLKGNLKALVFGEHEDGSRVVYDYPVHHES